MEIDELGEIWSKHTIQVSLKLMEIDEPGEI